MTPSILLTSCHHDYQTWLDSFSASRVTSITYTNKYPTYIAILGRYSLGLHILSNAPFSLFLGMYPDDCQGDVLLFMKHIMR